MMKRLLFILLLCCSGFAQNHTTVTVEDNQTVAGNKIFSGGISSSSYENVIQLDSPPYNGSLSAALAAITSANTTIHVPCGTFTLSGSLTVSVTGTQIVGEGFCSHLSINHTADAFLITGILPVFRNLQFDVTTT